MTEVLCVVMRRQRLLCRCSAHDRGPRSLCVFIRLPLAFTLELAIFCMLLGLWLVVLGLYAGARRTCITRC